MTALESLSQKIQAVASATALDEILTDPERRELANGHRLLQPMPAHWMGTAEKRYWAMDNLGKLQAVDCPVEAIRFVWPMRPAEDDEIVAGLIKAQRQIDG